MNTIKVPEGVDWAALVKNAMDKFNLEIAGGLGPTVGKVWRVSVWGSRPFHLLVEVAKLGSVMPKRQQGLFLCDARVEAKFVWPLTLGTISPRTPLGWCESGVVWVLGRF